MIFWNHEAGLHHWWTEWEILIRINCSWARLPGLLTPATHCSLYCPMADVTGALKVEQTYRVLFFSPRCHQTSELLYLINCLSIIPGLSEEKQQPLPRIYLSIYLLKGSSIVALSRFSSDFSHLLLPCDLHCVQLLLLKINCTSKLAIKIPILFYSILASFLTSSLSPKRSES